MKHSLETSRAVCSVMVCLFSLVSEAAASPEETRSCNEQAACIELVKKARELEQAEHPNQAIEQYQQAYDQFKDQRILLRLAKIYSKLGKNRMAVTAYRDYIESGVDPAKSPLMQQAMEGLREVEARPARSFAVRIDLEGPGRVAAAGSLCTKDCSMQLRTTVGNPAAILSLVAEPKGYASHASWTAPCVDRQADAGNQCTLLVERDLDVQVRFSRSRVRLVLAASFGAMALAGFFTGATLLGLDGSPASGGTTYSTRPLGGGLLGVGLGFGIGTALSLWMPGKRDS